jgi:hypothetical protein
VTLQVVIDDTLAVPETIRALVGVDRFGSLVFRRRTRNESMRAMAAAAGWPAVVYLSDQTDVAGLIDRLRNEDDDRLYLLCPSHVIPAVADDSVVTFLRQVQYAPACLYMPLDASRHRRGWSLMRASLLRKFLTKQQEGDVAGFFEENRDALIEVSDRLRLIDVSDERTLHDFLSGQFDARHFNAVEREEFTVIKRSTDRAKLRREYDYYRLLPPRMQMFLVQPFDFEDDGKTASYRMERISMPDMSLQWLHGAFQADEFERFLQHIFHFIAVRPERSVDRAAAAAARDALYVDKVAARIAALKALPAYKRLAPLLDNACGGIDALFGRYMDLYNGLRRQFPSGKLVVGHGDPCFSNILYSKTNQFLKLIDPLGASSEDELYTDPYYDIAKLSHSVLGNYDFINHGKFDIKVDEALGLRIEVEDPPPPWTAPMFLDKLEKFGFDPTLTRLFEVSLFISMLPLHIDRPRNALGFALNAAGILDTLTGTRGTDR